MKPQAADKQDGDNAGSQFADMLGVPAPIIVPTEAVVKVRQVRSQAQQLSQAFRQQAELEAEWFLDDLHDTACRASQLMLDLTMAGPRACKAHNYMERNCLPMQRSLRPQGKAMLYYHVTS